MTIALHSTFLRYNTDQECERSLSCGPLNNVELRESSAGIGAHRFKKGTREPMCSWWIATGVVAWIE